MQALWSFGGILMFPAKEKETVWHIFNYGWFIVIPYMALVLHFCLEITKIIKLKPWHFVLLYIPVLILLYGSQTEFLLYKDVLEVNGYWVFVLSADSAWSYFYILYYHLYIIFSIVLLFISSRKAGTFKEKRQSFIIFITLLTGLLLSFIEGIVVPFFTPYRTPALAPLYAITWMIGIWYSIIKYRFLTITPALVSSDIISNIDEAIILADNDMRILVVNNMTEKLTSRGDQEMKFFTLSDLIVEMLPVGKEISEMLLNNHKSFSARVHFINKNGSHVLLDVKFKVIHDKFGDPLGILIIGREVKELSQFKSIYKITNRQAEIIRHILQGRSNKEIAKLIGITERTIKGHISAIYYKLRINNKMELFNLLKDFNLIPEQPAEKSLIVI